MGERHETETGTTPRVRVDLWLWATRLFKTRALAVEACRKDRVRINGQGAKPSKQVRPDDRIEIENDFLTRTLRVKKVLKRRVGAGQLGEYLEDLTAPEVYTAALEARRRAGETLPLRDAGSGRPTKKTRRDLDVAMEAVERKEIFLRKMMKSVKRTLSLLPAAICALALLGGKGLTADPPARSFQPSDKSLNFQISKSLSVAAEEILPSLDGKTGLMTGLSATGSVLIKAAPEGAADEILISCDQAVYDAARDEVVLTGWPAVKSGLQILRATSPQTYVRVNRANGKWEIQGPHRIEISLDGGGKKNLKELFQGGRGGKR